MIGEGLTPLISELQNEETDFESVGTLGHRIGGGGFGEVYRWHHKLLNMDFAVKVLNPSFPTEDSRYVDRFFREARILLTLSHPGIVRVYDVGMFGRRPYIRMELLDGQDLNSLLQTQGPMDASLAAIVTLHLADALEHAHGLNTVHRDIKPSNVFYTATGRITLIDFGLGAFIEGDLVSRITKTGEAAVGGLFTAPELVANPRLLDPRSDLYSLGALWFNLLTGRPPAGTSVASSLDAQAGLSSEYRAVVGRVLADLAMRQSSAAALASEIRALPEVRERLV